MTCALRIQFVWQNRIEQQMIQSGIQSSSRFGLSEVVREVRNDTSVVEIDLSEVFFSHIRHAAIGTSGEVCPVVVPAAGREDVFDDCPPDSISAATQKIRRAPRNHP